MKKRGFSLLLAILMLMVQVPSVFANSVNFAGSGTCGNNLTWELDNNGTLVIRGTGAMFDYQYVETYNAYLSENQAPWPSSHVQNVVIEDGVTSIGDRAFFACRCQNITIPNSVTKIGVAAFSACSLKNITIPGSVTNIGAGAFWASALTNIELSNGLTSIGKQAFGMCQDLTYIVIPNSVINIGNYAFVSCKNLTQIALPNSITSIGDGLFIRSGLRNVTLSSGITSITTEMFSECSFLTNVIIPDGVVAINDGAFSGCSALRSVAIPNSVTSIDINAFSGCKSLTNITIPDGVKNISASSFAECENLSSVTIPHEVTAIGGGAFFRCENLTNIIIPDGVTSIGKEAFSRCSKLVSISIPNSVTSIGEGVFAYCESLENVYYNGGQQQWESIDIGANYYLEHATIHYNNSEPDSEPVTPTPVEPAPQANNDISKYSYAFGNDAKSFGYHSGYKIPLDSFQLIFGKTALAKQKCEQAFSESQSWEGSCYGMDATVGMIVVSGNGVSAAGFRNGATRPGELNASDTHASWNLTLTQFIEAMQISQYSSMSAIASRQNRNRLSALTSAVSAFENGGGGPVLICVYGPDRNGNYAGHALLAYHLDGQRLYVYDCNYPNDGTRAITLSNGGWSYTIADGVTWNNSNGHITYIPYETYLSNWMNRGHVQDMAYVSLVVNVADATVSDSAGNEVAVFQNGKMTRGSETAYPFTSLGITADGVSTAPPQVAVWLPVDEVYTVRNQDASKTSCKVSLCNVNQGVSVETNAASVTLLAEDASNTNSAMIASAGCNYTVTQMSGEDEVVFQGKTGRDKFISMITNGVSTERSGLTESTSVTMNGKPVALGNLPNGTTAVGILPSGFVDVSPGQYFYEPVMWAVDCGITNGTSETTFSPHNTCTRNHILTFLWRANGSPTALISNPFTDVDTLKDFGKAAVWAYEKGLVSGKQFNGGEPCSRADVVTYLWKLAGRPTAGRSAFTDVPSNADYAQAVSWAVERGVTNGTTDTTFEPSKICTRGQIVTFLYRAYVQN